MNQDSVSPAFMILILIALIAMGAAIWVFARRKRTRDLRFKFGPEYDKAVDVHGDRARAETDLAGRATRVARFHIHPLRKDERDRYADAWRTEQSRFVDDPQEAVNHADILVQDVMEHRTSRLPGGRLRAKRYRLVRGPSSRSRALSNRSRRRGPLGQG